MSLATFRNLTYTVNVVKWQTCNYALKIKSLVGFNSIFNIDLVSSTCQVVRWAFLIQYLFESICPTICISCKGEFISFGILWSQNIWFSFQLGETSGLSLRKLVPNPALQPQWKSTATVYVQTLILFYYLWLRFHCVLCMPKPLILHTTIQISAKIWVFSQKQLLHKNHMEPDYAARIGGEAAFQKTWSTKTI